MSIKLGFLKPIDTLNVSFRITYNSSPGVTLLLAKAVLIESVWQLKDVKTKEQSCTKSGIQSVRQIYIKNVFISSSQVHQSILLKYNSLIYSPKTTLCACNA